MTHAARLAVKATAAVADIVRRPRAGAVVLIYHRVGASTSSDVDLPVHVFEEQMAMLADAGRVRTLDDLADAVARRDAAAVEGAIVVTFDDGTADFAENAVPVLARHRIPATIYIATKFVEEQQPFPWGAPPISWRALVDTVSTGLVTVGSHTHGHLLLDRLAPGAIDDELDHSIELIGDRVGVAPAHFAYPKALAPSDAAAAAVRVRFRTAALAGTRANPVGRTDLQRLARSPVQVSDGQRYFGAKLRGGMRLEDDLRRIVARRRHSGAVT